jgi:hypothetical protein
MVFLASVERDLPQSLNAEPKFEIPECRRKVRLPLVAALLCLAEQIVGDDFHLAAVQVRKAEALNALTFPIRLSFNGSDASFKPT